MLRLFNPPRSFVLIDATISPHQMTEFQTLCSKHNVLDLYRWMGVRFPSIECFAEKSVAEM